MDPDAGFDSEGLGTLDEVGQSGRDAQSTPDDLARAAGDGKAALNDFITRTGT